MHFSKSRLPDFSKIKHEALYNEDRTVLMVKFSGYYHPYPEGIFDGMYMHSILVSEYFIYEPITIILDLRELDYTVGQTIFKSINFFGVIGRNELEFQKKVIIIASRENKEAIDKALSILPEPNQEICGYYETAIRIATQIVNNYFAGK